MRIGFIGLGEAGALYAAAAAAHGDTVSGFDPAAPTTPEGVQRTPDATTAVASADLVIVLTAASLSERIARDAAPHLREGAVYADFTTASPTTMETVERIVSDAGGRFADVAILGPVPTKGARTETIVSGAAAADVEAYLTSLGADVELIEGPAGVATSRKLLRSVLMKSLAAVVVEAVIAGRAAGCEPWIREQIAAQLSGDVEAKIERYETGSRKHAVRRGHEMASVVEYLDSLGVPSEMSAASRSFLERLAKENA
ncbi:MULTISPECIES: NAD(P)-dependent oxidoreductase [unclassified Rathayibacter]|uniref:NAD(P)-dependent oxidoreductase n=1 Tax=unclassified Rathayibacter TaxID=2609250 RepID=UPI00188DAD50|nr:MULTISPECIES: NAD(P)-binding domain-containing protein [unclassified Rathayibacter]MBF4461541.1 NAD(P)-dependent oxidoreductase [Rathayibacter sp. VKM Ac-2879]MBF4502952.1 NAD(P)-dependent oxidoreductase [Rathayibacter sp. VKM Ac-2878]